MPCNGIGERKIPLNGSGTYSAPPGTTATPNTTILSAAYNALVADLTTVLNTARPIAYGGTGGTSVITGWDGLAAKGTDIATAGTVNLTTATGPSLSLTGVTTITAVTLAEGSIRLVRAAGAFQITASASLLCNGSSSVNMTVSAEDLLVFRGGASSVVSVAKLGGGGAAATTSASGIVELATDAEALAGTDTVRAVVPHSLYYPTGHLFGLTLSNGTDATNDIDIAVGDCRSLDDTANMALASILTKQLDAAWAVGTNAGGLDTGSIANTTYHIWLIKRPDTGVVDALFSTSASAPTMPTNYTLKRRIGSIMRVSATIVPFKHAGDSFQYVTPTADISAGNPGTSAVTRTLPVPLGIRVEVDFRFQVSNSANSGNPFVLFSQLDQADIAPAPGSGSLADNGYVASGAGTVLSWGGRSRLLTNTSGQVRSRLSYSDASCNLYMSVFGWIDARGRAA